MSENTSETDITVKTLDRFVLWAWRAVIPATALCFLVSILLGRQFFSRGDESQRVLIGFMYAQDFWRSVLNREFFENPWLPGHFILQAGAIRWLLLLGATRIAVFLNSLHIVSLGLGLLAVFACARAAAHAAGRAALSITGLALCSLPALLVLLCTGMSEIYALAFLAFGLLFVTRALRESPQWFDALLGACFFLLSNTIRNEMIILIGVTFLFLLSRRRWRAAIVFGAVAPLFYDAKLAYLLFFQEDTSTNFLNFNTVNYHWSGGFADDLNVLIELMSRWCGQDGLFVALLAALCGWLAWRTRHEPGVWRDVFRRIAYWRWLLIGISAFIVAGVFLKTIRVEVRYAFYFSVLLTLTLGTVAGALYEQAPPFRAGRRSGAVLLALLLAALPVVGAVSYRIHRQTPPPELLDVIGWLQQHNPPGVPITFDFMQAWEQPALLYTMAPDRRTESFCYSQGPVNRPDPPDLSDPKAGGEVVAARMHAHLIDFKPRYCVLATDELYSSFERLTLFSYKHRPSYLRPYLRMEIKGEEAILHLLSPYLRPNEQVLLTPAYSNDWYMVLEVLPTAS